MMVVYVKCFKIKTTLQKEILKIGSSFRIERIEPLPPLIYKLYESK